jgi:4-hydroxy-4-methyl-2-oxoglutarate aldolase
MDIGKREFMNKVNQRINRLDPVLIEKVKFISSSATLHEAYDKKGDVDRHIKPIFSGMIICGSAFTVSCTPGDNLGLHVAITLARAGDVLVATTNGSRSFGYFGDIMSIAAIEKEISGLVIDGCVRDYASISKLKFPIFARGLCIKGTNKKSFYSINYPIKLGNIPVNPGDLILGDDDGVVVIAQDHVTEVVKKAIEREDKEKRMIRSLKEGKSTLEFLLINKS